MNIVLHCQFDYIKLLISCQATEPPFSHFISYSFYEKPHFFSPTFRHTEQNFTSFPPQPFRPVILGGWIFMIFLLTICSTFSPSTSLSPILPVSALEIHPIFAARLSFPPKAFPELFLTFFRGMPRNFPLAGTDRKIFSARLCFFAKKDWQREPPPLPISNIF